MSTQQSDMREVFLSLGLKNLNSKAYEAGQVHWDNDQVRSLERHAKGVNLELVNLSPEQVVAIGKILKTK